MRKILIVTFFLLLAGGILLYLRKQKIAEAPTINQTISQTSSSPSLGVVSELESLLAAKYNKNIESVKVTITKQQGDFVVGLVNFTGEGGGRLLAAKLLGAWKIVSDGNGVVPCDVVDLIKFPASLQPECWDTKLNQLEDRTQRPGMTLQQ